MTEQIQIIIEQIQEQIWQAGHFIAIEVNVVYWQGIKDGAQATLRGFKALGISTSEITSQMVKPVY